jgi:hypothetical protein
MAVEKPSDETRFQNKAGWLAVGLSAVLCCALAGLGTAAAFFNGYWAPSVLEYLKIMGCGLLPASILVLFTLLAIRRPRIGGPLHLLVGVFLFFGPVLMQIDAGFLPDPNHPRLPVFLWAHLTGILLVIMGIAYIKGRPKPRWLAMWLVAGLPIAISFICSLEPVWRMSHRLDDGITAARPVQGNGVELVWAPAGPGWPEQGNQTLEDAEKIVSRLTDDGLSVADSPQNIWRLPTIDEVVRSLTRNGQNAGGEWDPESGQARYRVVPDKESPLWRVGSPVVYWWTSSRIPERPDGHVIYIISYRGAVSKHYTFLSSADIGFRAVKGR